MSSPATAASDHRLGPLTTIFTPDAACLHDLQLAPTSTPASPSTLTLSLGNPSASCYPTPYHAVYSPGRCPSGYATVTTAPVRDALAYQVPLAADESASVCCPSAFTYANTSGGFCFQFASQTTATVTPQIAVGGVFNVAPLAGTTTSVFVGAASITANAIIIRYRSSDFSALDIVPPATSSSVTVESPSPSGSVASSSSSSGLSSKAKLAIGLGVSLPLASIILVALGFFLLRKRRARTAETARRPSPKHFTKAVSSSTVNVADGRLPASPPPALPKSRG